MNKEQLFQLVGVSYQVEENRLIFFTEKGDTKVYFPIDKKDFDGQVEFCSIDFFQTFKYLRDDLNTQLNGMQE